MQLSDQNAFAAAGPRARSQRGIVAVYVALLLVLVVGFAGLMLDTARVRLTAQELQRSADSAALAAVPFLDDIDLSAPLNYTFARDRAAAAGLANNAANAAVVLVRNDANLATGDIVVGNWDAFLQSFTPLTIPGSVPPGGPAIPNAIKVTARKIIGHPNGPLPLLFGQAFGATQSEVARSSVATRGAPKDPLIFILDPTGSRAMTLSGAAVLQIQSGVAQINSTHNNALFFNGNSAVFSASRIQVVGGSNKVVPNLVTGAPVVPDPFAGLPFPSPPYTAMSPAQITTGGTYPPGYYPGGVKSNGGTIVFTPGVYILGAPGIDLNNAILSATGGVTICLLAQQATWSPGGHADIELRGSGTVRAYSPTGSSAGVYNGVAIFMQPGNTGTVDVGGTGSLDIKGFIYGPSAFLDLGGTSSYSIGGIDVYRMRTQGNGFVTGISVPPGSGPPSAFLVE